MVRFGLVRFGSRGEIKSNQITSHHITSLIQGRTNERTNEQTNGRASPPRGRDARATYREMTRIHSNRPASYVPRARVLLLDRPTDRRHFVPPSFASCPFRTTSRAMTTKRTSSRVPSRRWRRCGATTTTRRDDSRRPRARAISRSGRPRGRGSRSRRTTGARGRWRESTAVVTRWVTSETGRRREWGERTRRRRSDGASRETTRDRRRRRRRTTPDRSRTARERRKERRMGVRARRWRDRGCCWRISMSWRDRPRRRTSRRRGRRRRWTTRARARARTACGSTTRAMTRLVRLTRMWTLGGGSTWCFKRRMGRDLREARANARRSRASSTSGETGSSGPRWPWRWVRTR